jgi:hypothetical protein
MQEHPWTQRRPQPLSVVKVVGLSASGKSTLVAGLRAAGYDARAVSQEHASVPDLWRRFDMPAVLIYLGVSLAVQGRRRADVTWTQAAHDDERARLVHAYAHADLRLDTSDLSPAKVLDMARRFLEGLKLHRADHPLDPRPTTGGSRRG